MTVCAISRNNALDRVLAVLRTGRDPWTGAAPLVSGGGRRSTAPDVEQGEDEEQQEADLVSIARTQIEARISSIFTGHDFTRLIAAILEAQGYQTNVSPLGADGGIDIVAGRGALGFEGPRIVVQVKSGSDRGSPHASEPLGLHR